MKLSFSLPSSRPSSKSTNSSSPHQSPTKEFITEFDPSKTLTDSDSDSDSNSNLIIPPIPNKFNPQNQTTSINPPLNSSHSNPQFEANPNITTIESNFKNGLNLRKPKVDQLLDSMSSIDRLMLMKLRSDLKNLPDDRGFEEFDEISVEEFGGALLRGYGWYEGRGIGKNAKEDVKVVEYAKNNGTKGLGFVGINKSDHGSDHI